MKGLNPMRLLNITMSTTAIEFNLISSDPRPRRAGKKEFHREGGINLKVRDQVYQQRN